MAKDTEITEHSGACMCSSAMWGHHHWGHMVIKIFIVLFIFWAGVQFGELKAAVANFNGGMMGGWGDRGNVYYTGAPMGGSMTTSSWAPASGAVRVQMMEVSTTTATKK